MSHPADRTGIARAHRPGRGIVVAATFLILAGATASAQEEGGGRPLDLDEISRLFGVREKVIAKVEKLGGRITIDPEALGRPVIAIDFSGSEVADSDLAMLKEFPELARLDLSNTRVTDAGLVHLEGLKDLGKLLIAGTAITDAGINGLVRPETISPYVSRRPRSLKFFADETLGRAGGDDFLADWYSEALFAMKEPSLTALLAEKPKAVAYRFLWVPSFHPALAVRIVPTEGGATLFAVRLERRGYHGTRPAITKSVKLGREQWQDFRRGVDDARFWTTPTDRTMPGIADGAGFVLEGLDGGKYHAVHANSRPDIDPDLRRFKALCESMVRMSDLDVMGIWKRY